MNKRFEIVFLEEVMAFLRSLDSKHYGKILYNIGKAQMENAPDWKGYQANPPRT